jgi:hypothetical protein
VKERQILRYSSTYTYDATVLDPLSSVLAGFAMPSSS